MPEKTQREKDMLLLDQILHDSNAPELGHDEALAFQDMADKLATEERWVLSKKQREWAEQVWDRVKPILASEVPRGREVVTPDVLRNPKEALKRKPPLKLPYR